MPTLRGTLKKQLKNNKLSITHNYKNMVFKLPNNFFQSLDREGEYVNIKYMMYQMVEVKYHIKKYKFDNIEGITNVVEQIRLI